MMDTDLIYLTWPASLPCVAVLRDQWRRNAAGEIEAWYTRRQLEQVVAMMRAARGMQT